MKFIASGYEIEPSFLVGADRYGPIDCAVDPDSLGWAADTSPNRARLRALRNKQQNARSVRVPIHLGHVLAALTEIGLVDSDITSIFAALLSDPAVAAGLVNVQVAIRRTTSRPSSAPGDVIG
jgi:hypothetical protein